MQRELPDWHELQLASHSGDPLCCGPEMALQEAARQMQARGAGSILICREGRPEGILTDKDLRRATAAGVEAVSTPVRQLMSSPVHTVHDQILAAEALAIMLRLDISHLVITEDGTPFTRAVGVVSQRDLLVTQGNSPAGLMREVRSAGSVETLREIRERIGTLAREYLEQGLPYPRVAALVTTLHDALTEQLIGWASAQVQLPEGVPFAWLALGSQGRGEQVFPSDQDNALLFGDVPDGELERTRRAFLEFATIVNDGLAQVGFSACPAGMMARNPKWCLSASEWTALFDRWIDTPDESGLMHSTIFFDFRSICGPPEMAGTLYAHIREHLAPEPVFLNYLGVDALRNPKALGFLGRFGLERDGENRGRFDLKARMLMPLVDSARLLILASGLDDPKNTGGRFAALARAEPQNAELFRSTEVVLAFLGGLRARAAWAQKSSGRYLDLRSLSRWDRGELRRCAKVIGQLQELVLVRFQLAHLL